MLKKLFVVGSGGILLLGLFFGRDAISYVKTSAGKIHQTVKNSVPIDFEIERAHKSVQDLIPEIQRNMHLIAKEEVKVERLSKKVDTLAAKLQQDKVCLRKLQGDLDSGKLYVSYRNHRYSREQIELDAKNRLVRLKTNDATLIKLEKVLIARQKSLDAARQKLEGMMAAKGQLEVDVANLEARLKMVEVAQTTSEFNFDDSKLARTKDLITEIQTRIDVAERMVNSEIYFYDEIPVEEPQSENIAEQINDYLGQDQPEIASIAETLN